MCGRVSSLIELGAGFHPDMSGRENIYINASIFGLKKKEIDERKDLNDAFDAMKANDEKALLKDIASDLSAIYKDFKDSEKVEMNMVLGEIYREKIKDVFSILEKKGIKVE